jgi:hypothetical protein
MGKKHCNFILRRHVYDPTLTWEGQKRQRKQNGKDWSKKDQEKL